MAAYCPSLDLATTGTDFQDAVKNFYECLQLHVECCMKMGTFEEDLKEHGWKVKGGHEAWVREGLKRTVIIQTHVDPVSELVVRKTINDIGLTLEEFITLPDSL